MRKIGKQIFKGQRNRHRIYFNVSFLVFLCKYIAFMFVFLIFLTFKFLFYYLFLHFSTVLSIS